MLERQTPKSAQHTDQRATDDADGQGAMGDVSQLGVQTDLAGARCQRDGLATAMPHGKAVRTAAMPCHSVHLFLHLVNLCFAGGLAAKSSHSG